MEKVVVKTKTLKIIESLYDKKKEIELLSSKVAIYAHYYTILKNIYIFWLEIYFVKIKNLSDLNVYLEKKGKLN